jgi:hypothetical protein
VRFLLSEGRTISQEELGQAVRAATEKGHEAIVRYLLSEGRTISEKDLGWAVGYAARDGHEAIVRFLLSEGRTISQEDLGLAVGWAARDGHEAIVRFLLSEGRTISQEELGQAVRSAAKNDHEAIVRYLLSEGRTISQEDLGKAVIKAAESRHERVVQFLLSEGRTISQKDLREAFAYALRYSHEAIVQILLPYFHEIPDRRSLILQSARSGWTAVLIAFLERGPIDRALQGSAITNAADEAIRDILRSAPIISEEEPAPGAAAGGGGGVRVAEDEFLLDLDDLKENPRLYLGFMADDLPRRMRLLNSPRTVDLGGVTQGALADLFEAIIIKELFPRTSEGLPLIRNEEHATCLWEIARLFSLIFKRNKDRGNKILTGNLFHERFLELVQVISSYLIKEEQIRRIATILESINPDYSIFTNVILRPSDENKEAFIQAFAFDTIEEAEEGAKAIVQEYMNAAKAFFNGTTDAFKEQLQTLSPIALLRSIQGHPISIENLLASLKCKGRNPNLIKKFEWLQQEMATSSDERRKEFVKAVTGKTTIGPGTIIEIKESWRDGTVFEIHTCFNSLDVPKGEMTKEDFLAGLELSINSESYNTA